MADDNDILLHLGYRTSSEHLRKYGYAMARWRDGI
jgi:hypothetical protein